MNVVTGAFISHPAQLAAGVASALAGTVLTSAALQADEYTMATVFAVKTVTILLMVGFERGGIVGERRVIARTHIEIKSAWAAVEAHQASAATANQELTRLRWMTRRPGQTAPRDLNLNLPTPELGIGYLYVIEFGTGSVKVGQTGDPKRRLSEHRRDSSAFGVTATNFWVSPGHSNYLTNEIELISRCLSVSPRSRREYFQNLTFAEAVIFAKNLTYTTKNKEVSA